MDKMREGFVKWFHDFYGHEVCFDDATPCVNSYKGRSFHEWRLKASSAWNAWIAAHKAAVPGGYCVVPVEPTRDMVTSGNDAMAYDCCTGDAGDAWDAMIANRPRF